MDYRFRQLTAEDQPILRRLVYYAIYVPPAHKPPSRDIVQHPAIAKYVTGWGRAGDMGWAAQTAGEPVQVVGAAWLRLFGPADRGYGYVRADIPELTIAVQPEERGQGLGSELMSRLIEGARGRCPAISLSVQADNPARRLYRRLGFETAVHKGQALTMILHLDPIEKG